MIGAVVLAGSPNNGPLKNCSPVPYEALIPIGSKMMVEYVVDALLKTPQINQVVVVGPYEQMATRLDKAGVQVIPAGSSALENVELGIRHLSNTYRVLVVTSDIPLITPQAVEDFLEQCSDQKLDVYYPVVSRQVLEKSFSRVKRTYIHLKEGVFTGGNIFLVNPEIFPRCLAKGQKLINARKNPLELSRQVGILFLIKFLLHRLSLREAEAKVSKLLGITGAAIISHYPEVGFDVDKPGDLALVTELLHSA